jgi:acyl-CoA reductase-like NAD-dependent aldehyde dehydrogenase
MYDTIAAVKHVTCYDPATGMHLQTLPMPTVGDVRRTVTAADAAQPAWAKTSFAQRKSVLRSIKAWVMRDMEDIVNVACRDTGKTRKCPMD